VSELSVEERMIAADNGPDERPPLEGGERGRRAEPSAAPRVDRARDGGSFILDAPQHVPAVWGRGEDVLWPRGELFLIVGPDGVGKGTLAQQLSCGLAEIDGFDRLLGLPINPRPGGILYVAADRPQQIARSWRRMVGEEHRAQLDADVTAWRGPLPFDLGTNPEELVPWLIEQERPTVIFDSLGALLRDPASDEAGSGFYRAMMLATAEGFDLATLYHPRKPNRDQSPRVNTVADVYGSRWITAAAGSILYLDGQAGDLIVRSRHLKQPAGEVGPITLRHDHEAGRTEPYETPDLLDLAVSSLTAKEAASSLFDTSEPTPNEIEKARRRLDKLADRGDLERVSKAGSPTTYRRPE
jgi:energy-coupling factor transporter ATP-binding protein EcfA2